MKKKIVIGDDGQGVKIAINSNNIKSAKARLKKLKNSHFQGADISEDFDYEVLNLI